VTCPPIIGPCVKLLFRQKTYTEEVIIGLNLKDNHLGQAINYAANEGVSWVILTNGIAWQLYKLKFGKPISYDLAVEFDLTELSARKEKDLEALHLISKEGVQKDCREELYQKILNVNKYIIGNLLLSDPIQNVIRRELKKFDNSLKVDQQEILDITENEIIKRDVIDSEDGKKAASKVKRHFNKSATKSKSQSKKETVKKATSSPFIAKI